MYYICGGAEMSSLKGYPTKELPSEEVRDPVELANAIEMTQIDRGGGHDGLHEHWVMLCVVRGV